MASLSLESSLQDIRLALRGFRRNLAFSASAVLVIALGTGVATAVFSMAFSALTSWTGVADYDLSER